MGQLKVRPIQESDVPLVVAYFSDLTDDDCERMGIDREQLTHPDDMRESLMDSINEPEQSPRTFILIWELDGEAIGMNTIKDMEPRQLGFMHLHMWAKHLRGKGYGRIFFCMAALDFYERFSLKQIYCEPCSTNEAPNRLLKRIGFPLVKTYIGQSSAIARTCELNRYNIRPDDCRKFLSR